jgi:uncharacterized membrane protein
MSTTSKSINLLISTAMSMAIANIAHAAAPNCSDVADKTSAQECQCNPVYNGKNLVKAGQTDCASKLATHSCAGQNSANEPGAWILLPAGVCDKINTGNIQDIPAEQKTTLCNRIECP